MYFVVSGWPRVSTQDLKLIHFIKQRIVVFTFHLPDYSREQSVWFWWFADEKKSNPLFKLDYISLKSKLFLLPLSMWHLISIFYIYNTGSPGHIYCGYSITTDITTMNLGLSLVKLRRRQRNGLSMKYSKAKKHRLWILKAREKRKEEKNKVMSYRSKIQVERKQEREWLRHNMKSEWWRRGNLQKEVRERRDERKSRNGSSLSCSAALLESIQYCVYSFEIDRQSLIHMIRQVTLNFTCCAEKMKQYATAHMHIVHIRTHKSSLHLPNPN